MEVIRTHFTKPSIVDRSAPAEKSDGDSMYQSAPYTQPPPPHLEADELQYLSAIGAFDAPENSIIKELLNAYIQHVHSFFPVLDLRVFLDAVLLASGRRVSLLLFHSVLAAGLAFVDPHMLTKAGWSTRAGFRDEMLRKVKVSQSCSF